MRSFSTLFASVTLIVSYGIQGADAGAGATHDKLNMRASIHRRTTNARSLKADMPPTLVKKSKQQRHCRPRPSSGSTTSPQNTTVVPAPPSPTSSSPNTGGSNPGSDVPVGNSDWKLDNKHEGATFFDNWSFINAPDYTHGIVSYQGREDPQFSSLAYVDQNTGRAIMKVDTAPTVYGNRASIRIEDTYKFNSGTLLIMDSTHMPVGCGTWPAFWTNHGQDWPVGGEIDIIEGVHNQADNLSSLHTTGGCSITNDGSFTGTVGNMDCTSGPGGNQGCNINNPGSNQPNNYGAGFNSIGGGVYAMRWDGNGISMWFFPRDKIPADITGNAPTPESWTTPYANFAFSGCSADHFFDNIAIFDTTLCGDWAGADWGSCAASTGYGSCEDYVRNNGAAFSDAYWEVNYVKYFKKN